MPFARALDSICISGRPVGKKGWRSSYLSENLGAAYAGVSIERKYG